MKSQNEKIIANLVETINKRYAFKDADGNEMKIFANPNLNGWELWLYRVNGGGVATIFTEHEQVPANVAVLMLKMLLWDVLEATLQYKHYSVTRRDP
jgi:hypothetical protein